MNTKNKLIALLAIATLISIVNASVFVYYPITLTISPQQPPVIFQKGDNADKPDLWGNTISVIIGDEGTSLSISIHPTLQRNYYYNISMIVNQDSSNAYYIKFRVTSPITDSRVSVAYLVLNNDGTQYLIDLKSGNLQPSDWITLSGSEKYRVDLYIELKDYTGSPSSIEVKLDLIITTTSTTETPPSVPPT